jgi:hypothetical protein
LWIPKEMRILVLIELHRGMRTLPGGQFAGGENYGEEGVFEFEDEELK